MLCFIVCILLIGIYFFLIFFFKFNSNSRGPECCNYFLQILNKEKKNSKEENFILNKNNLCVCVLTGGYNKFFNIFYEQEKKYNLFENV
jgi:hypothetical protein